jgi:glutathionylspermidine synthase
MKRVAMTPRANWQARLEETGFRFHTIAVEGTDGTYWDERVAYQFSEREIMELERAAQSLMKLCLDAVDHVIHRNRFKELRIPPEWAERCRQSWDADEPTLYGRFDFRYAGDGAPKMLEFNADTPTSLLEASVAQWVWLEDLLRDGRLMDGADQFNSIHEKLLEQLGWMRAKRGVNALHFASVLESDEDRGTVEYLRDIAQQVGMRTAHLGMNEIGWSSPLQRFVDLEEQPISHLFKLYPWEHLINEPFAQHLLRNTCTFIEPAWKMILSNKAILPILWELSPGHPNLLQASLEPIGGEYVRKPIFSREGANVTIQTRDSRFSSDGEYGAEGWVYQAYAGLPNFGSSSNPAYPVIGAWVVGDSPAGIGIREDNSEITRDTSRFVPHYFVS